MKKVIFTFITLGILFSCNNDDNESNSDIEIIGDWKLVGWYDDTPKDINNDGQESTDLFSQWDGCKKQSTLILSNDNTGKIVYNGGIENTRCPTGFETGDFFTTEPWKFDKINQTFTLIGDDYLDSYEVIELSSGTLILKGAGFFTCCDSNISYYTDGYLKFEKD